MATTKKAASRKASRATTKRAPARTRREKGVPPELFAELLQSVREAKQIMRGELTPARTYTADEIRAAVADDRRRAAARDAEVLDAAMIRERMGLSQAKFATLLGISPRTLQGWEQGRREPKGAERTLLRVAARHPEALLEAAAG
jgi:putative transcriptional regulator